MLPGPPRRRRARPVADAPIDALIARAEDLAKGWLLTLLEQAPLDDAPGILAADLARDGPRVCTAVVRALADDDDLRRIEPDGALELLVSRAGEFAGAIGPEATSRAVDALSAVIWSGVRAALADPEPEQVYELAERLAFVIELVRGAALRHAEREMPAAPDAGSADAGEPVAQPPRRRLASVAPAAPTRPSEPDQDMAAGPPADGAAAPGPDGAAALAPDGAAALAPDGAAAPGPDGARLEPRSTAPPSEPLWMGALEDEVQRSERSGAPLALLLVELDDAERIAAAETARDASATFGRFAQAIRSIVRRGDILACETEARAWIIARDTGRAGAQALGRRAVDSVHAARPWRGAPMTVSVGLAVLGEDGRDGSTLAEAAEEARWAAAASGSGVEDYSRPDPDRGPRA